MKNGIDFIARMVVEWLDLLDKTIKLNHFMETNMLWKRTDYAEITAQRNAMENYALALARRLVNLGIDLNELLTKYCIRDNFAVMIADEAKAECEKSAGESNENANRDGE